MYIRAEKKSKSVGSFFKRIYLYEKVRLSNKIKNEGKLNSSTDTFKEVEEPKQEIQSCSLYYFML